MVQQKSITSFFQPRGTGGAAGAPMKRSALVVGLHKIIESTK